MNSVQFRPGREPGGLVSERPWDPGVWEALARDGRDLLFRVGASAQ